MSKYAKHSKENVDKLKKSNKACKDNSSNDKEEIEFEVDEELIELEFDEESIVYYIVDENNNEIGVCLLEDGKEVEYMYEKNNDEKIKKINVEDIKKVKKNLEVAKKDAVDIAKELNGTLSELQEVYNNVKDSFKIFPNKKKK